MGYILKRKISKSTSLDNLEKKVITYELQKKDFKHSTYFGLYLPDAEKLASEVDAKKNVITTSTEVSEWKTENKSTSLIAI